MWKVRIHRLGGATKESVAFATVEQAEAWAYANVTPDDGTFEVLEDKPWSRFNEGIKRMERELAIRALPDDARDMPPKS